MRYGSYARIIAAGVPGRPSSDFGGGPRASPVTSYLPRYYNVDSKKNSGERVDLFHAV